MKTFKILFASFLLFTLPLFSGEVNISWDHNPKLEGVYEYKLYRTDNTAEPVVVKTVFAENELDVAGQRVSTTITAETGWKFAVSAFNGVDGPISDPVTVPKGPAPATNYTIVSFSSEESANGDRQIGFAFDNDPNSYWESDNTQNFPHEFVIDLGSSLAVRGVLYTVAQTQPLSGAIGQFEVYVSNDVNNWSAAPASGSFSSVSIEQTFLMTQKIGRFVKFKALNSIDGGNVAKIGEINFITSEVLIPSKPTGLKVEWVK